MEDVLLNLRLPVMQPPITNIDTQNPMTLLKSRRAAAPLPLIHLVRTHRRFRTTDPRDKSLYFARLSGDAKTLGIKADYHQDCNQVYNLMARKFL
jgi:hypothetical protein